MTEYWEGGERGGQVEHASEMPEDFVFIQLIPPSRRDVRKEENLYSNAPYVRASLMKLCFSVWNLQLHFYDPFLFVHFFKAMQLKSSLLTIKVFELTFYILHSQLISHCLRVLAGIRVHGELWGLGREPDPVPTGYAVCAHVQRLLFSYQRQCSLESRLHRAVVECMGYLETEKSCACAWQ